MLLGFFGVFGLYESFQVAEVHLPETAVLIEPGVDGAKRFGIELVDAVTAFAMLTHEMGAAQQAQMFGDCGTGDGKSAGDSSGGLAASAKKVENSAAGGIGEGLEGGLRVSFRGICNRTVPHNT